jgi:hypothetical protein
VAGRQADDLAQELLVYLAEHLGGQDRELVGRLGIVQPGQQRLERLVVDGQGLAERVGLEVE